MTTYPTQLPDLAAPPATHGEEHPVLNGLVEENLAHKVKVPQLALMDGDRICEHPETGEDVDWKVTARRRDEDGHLVASYRAIDGVEDEFTFTDPGQWVRVSVGRVLK